MYFYGLRVSAEEQLINCTSESGYSGLWNVNVTPNHQRHLCMCSGAWMQSLPKTDVWLRQHAKFSPLYSIMCQLLLLSLSKVLAQLPSTFPLPLYPPILFQSGGGGTTTTTTTTTTATATATATTCSSSSSRWCSGGRQKWVAHHHQAPAWCNWFSWWPGLPSEYHALQGYHHVLCIAVGAFTCMWQVLLVNQTKSSFWDLPILFKNYKS